MALSTLRRLEKEKTCLFCFLSLFATFCRSLAGKKNPVDIVTRDRDKETQSEEHICEKNLRTKTQTDS
jgi:hypothetical protein